MKKKNLRLNIGSKLGYGPYLSHNNQILPSYKFGEGCPYTKKYKTAYKSGNGLVSTVKKLGSKIGSVLSSTHDFVKKNKIISGSIGALSNIYPSLAPLGHSIDQLGYGQIINSKKVLGNKLYGGYNTDGEKQLSRGKINKKTGNKIYLYNPIKKKGKLTHKI